MSFTNPTFPSSRGNMAKPTVKPHHMRSMSIAATPSGKGMNSVASRLNEETFSSSMKKKINKSVKFNQPGAFGIPSQENLSGKKPIFNGHKNSMPSPFVNSFAMAA